MREKVRDFSSVLFSGDLFSNDLRSVGSAWETSGLFLIVRSICDGG